MTITYAPEFSIVSSRWVLLVGSIFVTIFASSAQADIQFQNVTPSAGINYVGESWGASWGDLNSDGYPDLFTSNHRARPSLYINNKNGSFSDVSRQVDVSGEWDKNPKGDTHGATIVDFDNDGDQDLMVAAGGSNGTRFYINENGKFTERSQQYGVRTPTYGGRFATWFDYNNDGWLDFLMGNSLTYAELFRQNSSSFTQMNSIQYCNENPYGQLSDVTENGRMELLCAHESRFPDKIYDFTTAPFINLSSTLKQITSAIDTAIVDFNGDLRPDILTIRGVPRPSDAVLVGNKRVEAHLALGKSAERGFTFNTTGVITIEIDWSTVFKGKASWDQVRIGSSKWTPNAARFSLDPNNSNVLGKPSYNTSKDHGIYIWYVPSTSTWQVQISGGTRWSTSSYIVDSTAPVSNVQAKNQIPSERPMSPVLNMKTATGYSDETQSAGLDTPISCVSIAAADFDNDMDIDVYLACRGGTSNIANILYANDGSGNFTQVTGAGGAQGIMGAAVSDQAGTAESVVAADYDVDGFIDLMVTNGINMQPYHSGGPFELFHNVGNQNHWVEIDLQGSISNRDGIGASVYVTAGGVTQLREQGGGYHRWSQHDKRLHFGLAGNTLVSVRIEWPSGTVETYNDIQADRLYRASEDTGIEVRDLAVGGIEPKECWQPTYNNATDSGIFVWKNCDTGSWHFRVAAGGIKYSTSGTVVADQAFTSVTPLSIEPQWGDVLDYTSDPSAINYLLKVNNGGFDGFDFTYPAGASVCLGVDAPPGTTVRLGLSAMEIALPFDLATLAHCGSGLPGLFIDDVSVAEGGGTATFTVRLPSASTQSVSVDYATADNSATAGSDYMVASGNVTFAPGETTQLVPVTILDDSSSEGNETFTVELSNPLNAVLGDASATGTIIDDDVTPVCDAPSYDSNVDREVFLWQDCVAGVWHARFTAGGGAFQTYTGTVGSDQAFSSVTPFSIESGDMLDYSTDPTIISYQLGMTSRWEDGFDFAHPVGANVCFGVDLPAGTAVLVGPGRTPVIAPFVLDTLQPC